MRETKIDFNLKSGDLDVTMNGKRYQGKRGFIESQRDMLIGYRDDGRVPSQDLLDDIAAYEYILEHDKVDEYQAWREKKPAHLMRRPRHYYYEAYRDKK